MTPTEYIATFELEHPGYSSYPINYQHYIPLNKSRFTRSLKQGVITQELTEVIKSINEKQDWIVIFSGTIYLQIIFSTIFFR
jgi:hypothetical protein